VTGFRHPHGLVVQQVLGQHLAQVAFMDDQQPSHSRRRSLRAAHIRATRAKVLTAAYLAHPERFVRQPPAPPKPPAISWINQREKEPTTQ
jgi:hypothetical protein